MKKNKKTISGRGTRPKTCKPKWILEKNQSKAKLHYNFRHNHLVPLVGFRVDLYENEDEYGWGRMDESVSFVVEKIENNKLYVKVYHMKHIGEYKHIGKHLEDSHKLYEVDLSKDFDESNVKEVKEIDTKEKLWKESSLGNLLELLTGETFRVVESSLEERLWRAVSKSYEFKFIDCGNGWCKLIEGSFKKRRKKK